MADSLRNQLIFIAFFTLIITACAEKTPAEMVYGGHSLSIPANYFYPWTFPTHEFEPDSLILRTYWPKYGTGRSRPVEPERKGGHEDKITVILSKQPVSLQPAYALVASVRIETVSFHNAFGLRAFHAITFGEAYGLPNPRVKALEGTDAPVHREIYFAHRDQMVTILIVCEPWHRSPKCVHRFNADEFGFELVYSMDHLADWRAIQSGVESMVAGFLVNSH